MPITRVNATVRILTIPDGRSEVETRTRTEAVYDPDVLLQDAIDAAWAKGEPIEAEVSVAGQVVSRWANRRY